ncbi:citryl-CoA lyase [Candidatus Woesearchaeota archaeon]|nr:citryl-CoA lyase [Candidatus Woesearchaeota archaeon]
MEYKTSISKITSNDTIIRGKKLSSLAEGSFTDAVFLLLNKRSPSQSESHLFSVMMTLSIDHGMGTTSSMATRFVASAGNALNASVAAGILALGEYHGGAIEEGMKMLMQVKDAKLFVASCLKHKKTLFGFGHKIYKEQDPRVVQLLSLCKKIKYSSKHVAVALALESELAKQKGKKIPLNVDGVMAALLLDMGFSPEAGRAVFLVARSAGLAAQTIEEKESGSKVRRVEEEEIVYGGK